MVKGFVKGTIVFCVIVGMGYPVIRERAVRAEISRSMINTLDANDAAALRQWPGNANSFVAMLHERCLSTHSRDTTACARYQLTN